MVFIKNILDGYNVEVLVDNSFENSTEKREDKFVIKLNPNTIERLNVNLDYVAWHEVFHILFNHFNVHKEDQKIWNYATDMVINQIIGLTFDPFIYPGKYGLPTNLTEEEYYDILMKMKQDSKQNNSNNSDQDEQNDEQNNESDNSEQNNSNQDDSEQDNTERDDDNKENDSEQDEQNDESSNSEQNNSNQNDSEQDNKSNDSEQDNSEQNNNKQDSSEQENSEQDEFKQNDINNALTRIEEDIEKGLVYFNDNNEGFADNDDLFISKTKIINYVKEVKETMPDIYKKMIYDITSVLSNRIEMVETKYENTYMKFNNRKNRGNVILPGRRKVNGGVKKNFSYSPVVFIDISASTSNKLFTSYRRIININDALNVIAKELHDKYNATIIFYNFDVKNVILPKQNFEGLKYAGGTSINRSLRTAINQGLVKKDSIITVITDGEDRFDNIINNYKHIIYKVYPFGCKLISKKIA